METHMAYMYILKGTTQYVKIYSVWTQLMGVFWSSVAKYL